MITLADVTEQLKTQTKDQVAALEGVRTEVGSLSSSMKSFLRSMSTDKLKDREAELESSPGQARVKSSQQESRADVKSAGLFGGMLDAFQAGGIMGIAGKLAKYLFKYGLPAIILNALAQGISDYIAQETNREQLADAVFGALKLGSVGLLFGKKFGLIGAIFGAIIGAAGEDRIRGLTQEMQIQLENMEVNLAHFMGVLSDFIGVSLPGLEEVFTYLVGAPLGAMKAINGLLSGDFEEFFGNLDELATTVLGLALLFKPGGTFRLMKKAVGGLAAALVAMRAAEVPGVPMTSRQNLPGVLTPDKDGMVTDKKGNKWKATSPQGRAIIQASKDNALRAAANNAGVNPSQAGTVAKKYPRFGKLLGILNGIPGANMAINAGMLALILMDEKTSDDEKVRQGAGLFTGVAGSALGAAIGSAIFPGIGTAVGGVGGYFLGDALGQYAMQWLMGKGTSDEIIKGLKKGVQVDPSITTGEFDHLSQYGGQTSFKTEPTSFTNYGVPLEDAVAQFNANSSKPNIIMQDNSSNVVSGGSTSQAIAISASSPVDSKDPLMGTRAYT